MSKPYLTPEEYLEIERKAEFKSEYYKGEMFPMGGNRHPGMRPADQPEVREWHILVAGNAFGELWQQLRGRPCRTYSGAMRVGVSRTGPFTYPDVVVVGGEPEFVDETRDTLLNPTVIIEVFTESSEGEDRGDKGSNYRSLQSVSEYLLISSERVGADLYRRRSNGTWDFIPMSSSEGIVHLQSIDCHLRLADLYERVDFSRA